MKSLLVRILLAAACLIPAAASSTYVYNTITYPGAVFTDVRGLNNDGQIVGYASLDAVNFFAFSYEAGVYTPLPPTVFPVAAHGVNDAGVIIGSANNGLGPTQGFIFNAGSYAFFSRPGWEHTFARMINNAGLITGYSEDSVTGANAGYIYNPFTSTTPTSPPRDRSSPSPRGSTRRARWWAARSFPAAARTPSCASRAGRSRSSRSARRPRARAASTTWGSSPAS